MLPPPIVDSQVYVCSNFVRVYNLLAGSQVTVFNRSKKSKNPIQLGAPVQAGGGEVFVPVDSNIKLQVGDFIFARAHLGTEDRDSEDVQVLAVPKSISPPLTHSVLYAGGTCLGARGEPSPAASSRCGTVTSLWARPNLTTKNGLLSL